MSKARVLLIEDEELIAILITRLLVKFGYEPLDHVAYGEDVMERIRESNPDLLLVDIHLKGKMDGIDAVIAMKEKYDIPFVYITGNTDPSTLHRAMATSPAGYLRKPFLEQEWKSAIEIALITKKI